jgi:hypothetical protein
MTRGRKEIGSQGVAPDTDQLVYFLRVAALWLLSERARFPQTSSSCLTLACNHRTHNYRFPPLLEGIA